MSSSSALQYMRISIVSLLTIVLSFFITSCRHTSTQSPPPEAALPEITSESEEGFHDFVFATQHHIKLSDGSQTILASGTYKGKKVSLEIDLGAEWTASPLDRDVPITTFRGAVRYRSVGAESDLLIQVMDEVYGTKMAPNAMNRTTEFTAISLQGNPSGLTKDVVKIKLFFETNDEDQYAELFTNIDLKAQKVYISEKDEEYRASIVRALQAR